MKILIKQTKELDELKNEIISVGDSIKDFMKQGDSKVKIKFNNNF